MAQLNSASHQSRNPRVPQPRSPVNLLKSNQTYGAKGGEKKIFESLPFDRNHLGTAFRPVKMSNFDSSQPNLPQLVDLNIAPHPIHPNNLNLITNANALMGYNIQPYQPKRSSL